MIRRGALQAILVGRVPRITPEAVMAAERLMAAPTAAGRRRRLSNGIDREVAALLDDADAPTARQRSQRMPRPGGGAQ
jgi:hypothetical protein